MFEVALASLALAFGASIALNIYQSVVVGRLKRQIRDRDNLIDDLNAALGGASREESDWRRNVL